MTVLKPNLTGLWYFRIECSPVTRISQAMHTQNVPEDQRYVHILKRVEFAIMH